MKKKVALIIFIGLILISIIFLIRYMIFNDKYTTSDAAFVKSDTLTYLSFKLPGQIDKLTIHSGDSIKKGELIAKLSTKELNTTLKEIRYNISSIQNKINSLKASKQKLINNISLSMQANSNDLKMTIKKISALSFGIDAMKVKLAKIAKDVKRYKVLYRYHRASLERLEDVQTSYNSLKNSILSKQNSLQALILSKNSLYIKAKMIANERYGVVQLSKTIKSLNDNKKAFTQKSKLIQEKIGYSYIYAPFNGVIARKFVNNHQVVDAGENVVAEVDLKHIYVSVLLEESKLKNLKVGNQATVHVDAVDKNFKAVISKILPASASTFAIVPRDISSGEFTKLQQRFIVKLRFLNPTKNLRVGMSAEATIRR